jgi:hypothetical protein
MFSSYREDAGKGVLLWWNKKSCALMQSPLPMGNFADGDVRDVVWVQTTNGERLQIITKNGNQVQVIKTRTKNRNQPNDNETLFPFPNWYRWDTQYSNSTTGKRNHLVY